ncbi:hemicentin-1 isoform X2 [Hydra vulgaris]|uniref:Hemicentin-1 isoform X2 n=1 Tax=Hydra vulgaris TaxID=6087 RepID=A0ABM4B855_HYDVU
MQKLWMCLLNFLFISVHSSSFNNTPQDLTLGELGGSVTLLWQVTTTQIDFIRWFKTNKNNNILLNIMYKSGNQIEPIVGTNYIGRVSTPGSAILTINKLTASDEGLIGCNVDFTGGQTVLSKIYLEVGGRPQNTLLSLESAPIETKELRLTCSTSSKPAAVITWFDKDDNALQNNSRYFISAPISVNNNFYTNVQTTLTIINIQINDTGFYKCLAKNELGFQTLNTSVVVQYKPINTVLQLQFGTSFENDINKLTCTTFAFPSLIFYQFYFENTLIQNTTNNVYVFNPVKNYYQGKYTCKPRNIIGDGASDMQVLTVYVKAYIFDGTDSSITVNEGDPVSLICNACGQPSPDVTWSTNSNSNNTLNINTFTKSQNATLFQIASEVSIRPTTRANFGNYICYAKNTYGQASYNITLNVQYIPYISYNTLDQENFYAKEGSSSSFSCSAIGNPQPTIKWYRDNVEIVKGKHSIVNTVDSVANNFVKVSSTINFNDVSKYDAGVLKCEASNVVGKASKDTSFNVYYMPVITAQMNPAVYVNLGTGLSLSCTVNSIEQSNFYWFKNGKLILNNIDGSQIVETKVGNSIVSSYLTINPILIDDSNVVFMCQANNSLGMDSRSTLVSVYYGPKIIKFPDPLIVIREHTFYSINCIAQANPKPTIVWFKNGDLIVFNVTSFKLFETIITSNNIVTVINSTIAFIDVKRENFGNWTCQASNNIVNSYSVDAQTTKITVTYPPVFEFLSPNPTIVNVSSNVILLCRVKASPKPYVWWQTPSGILPDQRYTTTILYAADQSEFGSTTAELTILSIKNKEYGQYTCMANNTIVSTSISVKLVVQYSPTAISDFQIPLQTYPEFSIKFIQVVVDSNPPAIVEWFISRDNGTSYVKLTRNIQTTQLNIVLDFEYKVQSQFYFPSGSLLRTDQAFYKVKISHIFGVTELLTWLVVYWTPQIETQIANSQTIMLNQKVSFICRFYSNPMSQINWFKDNVLVTDVGYLTTPLKVNLSMTLSESTFTLLNVLKSDRANYSCNATNTVGSATMWHYLDVLYPPKLIATSSTIFVNLGSDFSLSCEADANPPVNQYNWKRMNESFDFNKEIYVTNAQKNTDGNYSCVPENSIGYADTVFYSVFIIIPPKFTLPATCVKFTNTYSCYCQGDGFPTPDAYWTRYQSDEIIINGTSLNVTSSPSNDGTYVCHLKLFNYEITTYFQIADFTPIYGVWSQWSACNATCRKGISIRNRVCILLPCTDQLVETEVCLGKCPAPQTADSINWNYALFALIPGVLLLVLGIIWIVRKTRTRNTIEQQT